MRIVSLDLENVKSYARARLDFTSGLNAICGQNGSGKSTALEAIGYALFDSLPYPQDQFIREGEKFGTIRVRLLTGDEREYEVVRRFGSVPLYYVLDVETSVKLAERKEGVLSWVRGQALRFGTDTDLSALFDNALGVPQGMMTSDFRQPANRRKGIFDPLLRVEEYGKASEYLREPMNLIRDRRESINADVIRLEVDADAIPPTLTAIQELRASIQQVESDLVAFRAELARTEVAKRAGDHLKQQLVELDAKVQAGESEVRRSEADVADSQRALRSAQEAHEIATATQPGFDAYQAARIELASLDVQRSERDSVMKDLANAKSKRDGTREQIERLDQELHKAREAGQAALALEQLVQNQADIEKNLQEARLELQKLTGIVQQCDKVSLDIEKCQERIGGRAKRLEESRVAALESKKLSGIQQHVRDAERALRDLDNWEKELAEVVERGEQLRKQQGEENQRVLELTALRSRHQTIQPDAEKLPVIAGQRDEIRAERDRLGAERAYQSVARAQLSVRNCPLLDIACPVVSADAGALQKLDAHETALGPRLADVENRLSALDKRVTHAQEAAHAAQDLAVKIAGMAHFEDTLPVTTRVLEECRERYKELEVALKSRPEAEQRLTELQSEETRLLAAEKTAALGEELQAQQESDQRQLTDHEEELKRLNLEGESMRHVEEQEREMDAAYRALEDPRARQQLLVGQAARIPELEGALALQQEHFRLASTQFDDLAEQLRPFASLDDRIKIQRDLEALHHEAYERHLLFEQEARRVEERKKIAQETRLALERARIALETVRAEHATRKSHYSPDEHSGLNARYEALVGEVASENTKLTRAQQDLTKQNEELEHLRRQECKLLARREDRAELDETESSLKFIRETIKAAGPMVTETLLYNISVVANDIHAEIVDDHAAELRWNKDYDIVVQRGAEDRHFGQLSGGEQMTAALSVRLALLKEMSEVDFAFFDEPTQNLDGERRVSLAGQIGQVRGFDQLIVISHDDTFEQNTDHLIRLRKVFGETQVDE
jgi:DNA repair protein SbcC/Rad50